MEGRASVAQLPASDEGDTRLFRMGTFFWSVHPDTDPDEAGEKLVKDVVSQLTSDSRVTYVVPPDFEHGFCSSQTFYPSAVENFQAMMFGSDALEALEVTPPIMFRIQVPIKNQPLREGRYADIPSDSYWAAWNGITLVVMWSQYDDEIPMSGGHVVIDVLRDAVAASGAKLVNQACSSGCSFKFIHSTMVIAFTKGRFYRGWIGRNRLEAGGRPRVVRCSCILGRRRRGRVVLVINDSNADSERVRKYAVGRQSSFVDRTCGSRPT
jgi:hypothetical protein